MPLRRKKVDYILIVKEAVNKRFGVKLTKTSVAWILGRFIHYSALLLAHGFYLVIKGRMTFRMYYKDSDDFKEIEKESRFAKSPSIHGVFFTIVQERGWTDQYKAEFKPSIKFRNLIEEHLDNPDLSYKLIA